MSTLKDIANDVKTVSKSVDNLMKGHKIANFFIRHKYMFFLFILMIGLYMYSLYDYREKIDTISILRQENNDLQIRQNILSSELIKITLEENIINRVNERGLGLSVADTSLIIINRVQ